MTRRATVLYRYGPAAWVWRLMILFFCAIGAVPVVLVRDVDFGGIVTAAIMFGPSLFFGFVVAVRVDRVGEETVRVVTLIFWRRRIRREELGSSTLRREYIDDDMIIDAPRLWVPVKHALPIYIDLMGDIPDKQTFAEFFVAPPRQN